MVAGVPAVARVVLDGRARARAVTDEDERTGVAIARLGGGLMMIDGSGRAGLAAVFGRDGDQRVIASVDGRNRDAAARARVPPEGLELVADAIRAALFISAREKLGLERTTVVKGKRVVVIVVRGGR